MNNKNVFQYLICITKCIQTAYHALNTQNVITNTLQYIAIHFSQLIHITAQYIGNTLMYLTTIYKLRILSVFASVQFLLIILKRSLCIFNKKQYSNAGRSQPDIGALIFLRSDISKKENFIECHKIKGYEKYSICLHTVHTNTTDFSTSEQAAHQTRGVDLKDQGVEAFRKCKQA